MHKFSEVLWNAPEGLSSFRFGTIVTEIEKLERENELLLKENQLLKDYIIEFEDETN